MMRLTIDLPDLSHGELKTSAAAQGITVNELILQRIASDQRTTEKAQSRWTDLALRLETETSFAGLSHQLASNKNDFYKELPTEKADW